MSFISIFILMSDPCHSFYQIRKGVANRIIATVMRIPIMSFWSYLGQSGEPLGVFEILADVARRSIVTL